MTDFVKRKTLYYRILPTTTVGNSLEFFDFTLYEILAVAIGKLVSLSKRRESIEKRGVTLLGKAF
jgi:hypothetical protein